MCSGAGENENENVRRRTLVAGSCKASCAYVWVRRAVVRVRMAGRDVRAACFGEMGSTVDRAVQRSEMQDANTAAREPESSSKFEYVA